MNMLKNIIEITLLETTNIYSLSLNNSHESYQYLLGQRCRPPLTPLLTMQFYFGTIFSIPPMYGCNFNGMVTLPSEF